MLCYEPVVEITKIYPGAVFAVVKISTTVKQLQQSTHCILVFRQILNGVQIQPCFFAV